MIMGPDWVELMVSTAILCWVRMDFREVFGIVGSGWFQMRVLMS